MATVACSQTEPLAAPTVVPQPTAPPVPAIDPAALSSMVQQAVQGVVTEAVQQVSASSAQDMEAAISRAMADLPTGVSAADMQAAVNSAIATLPAGVSAADGLLYEIAGEQAFTTAVGQTALITLGAVAVAALLATVVLRPRRRVSRPVRLDRELAPGGDR